ncbi:MAG: SGNH/GDSL hydrolase family protein, partial [Planctomycetaceae bacterium]
MNCRQALRWATIRLLSALLVTAMLAAVLYIAEFCFWLADPQRRLPPSNQHIDKVRYSWGQPIHLNRFGFRSRELQPKPPGTFRIMVLGDSMTWGAGIAVEQRYTDILERLLNADFQTDKFEVHNFGVSGGPMILHARILEWHIGIVQPDLIIVGFCYNDADMDMKKPGDWSPEKQRFDDIYGPCLESVRGYLTSLHLAHIGVRTEKTIRRIAEACGAYPDWITVIDRTYDPNSTQWRTFVGALETIKQISDDSGL